MDTFDILREAHEGIVETLVDEDDFPGETSNTLVTDAPSSTSGSRAFSTSAPSVVGSRSVHGFSSIQPQFNLDSATSLLVSFRDGMLPYFPITVLPPDTRIPTLAKERPFVLLAILAAASGGRSLQGHNLYDEEFRKVLGLKFVSGGERSLELLVGLLIYCAWYASPLSITCTTYCLRDISHPYLRETDRVQVSVSSETKEQASFAVHSNGQRYCPRSRLGPAPGQHRPCRDIATRSY